RFPLSVSLCLMGRYAAHKPTREAHKPAKPTNSWGATRTVIKLDHSGIRDFKLGADPGHFINSKFSIQNQKFPQSVLTRIPNAFAGLTETSWLISSIVNPISFNLGSNFSCTLV